MKRITPEEVVQAYITTGLRPSFKEFIGDNGRSGCAITAVLKSYGHECRFGSIGNLAQSIYGIPYVNGFWNGFDGYSFDGCDRHLQTDYKCRKGWEDGCEARKAVLSYMEQGAAPTVQLAPEALSVAPVPSNEAVAS